MRILPPLRNEPLALANPVPFAAAHAPFYQRGSGRHAMQAIDLLKTIDEIHDRIERPNFEGHCCRKVWGRYEHPSSALPYFAQDFENITKKKPDFLCRKASNYSDISSAGVAVPTDLLSFHKLSGQDMGC